MAARDGKPRRECAAARRRSFEPFKAAGKRADGEEPSSHHLSGFALYARRVVCRNLSATPGMPCPAIQSTLSACLASGLRGRAGNVFFNRLAHKNAEVLSDAVNERNPVRDQNLCQIRREPGRQGGRRSQRASAPAIAFLHSQASLSAASTTKPLRTNCQAGFDQFGFQTLERLLRTVKVRHEEKEQSCEKMRSYACCASMTYI
ncbi:hypothetical protein [Paraburkholderia sp. BR10882]|uniref:hypothetical protein n=1 Tax=Paraburkholderia sp. BR10882 TaxID=3236991 RepID=UPI0034CE4074